MSPQIHAWHITDKNLSWRSTLGYGLGAKRICVIIHIPSIHGQFRGFVKLPVKLQTNGIQFLCAQVLMPTSNYKKFQRSSNFTF